MKQKWNHKSVVVGNVIYHNGGARFYGSQPRWIEKWKDNNSFKRTKKLRPDLF